MLDFFLSRRKSVKKQTAFLPNFNLFRSKKRGVLLLWGEKKQQQKSIALLHNYIYTERDYSQILTHR
jgi:hypothetical protein|tara:strand:+ start:791 stop:991 length:201 start_codon:yes stop_codon:yes gene_type:complete